MANITAKNNESFQSILRRFKRSCDEDKIVQGVRERQYFEKPSMARKIAKGKAVRRAKAKIEKENELRNKKY